MRDGTNTQTQNFQDPNNQNNPDNRLTQNENNLQANRGTKYYREETGRGTFFLPSNAFLLNANKQ